MCPLLSEMRKAYGCTNVTVPEKLPMQQCGTRVLSEKLSCVCITFVLNDYYPFAHAQRGKVIGSVVVFVSTKIARSRVLGEFISATCS